MYVYIYLFSFCVHFCLCSLCTHEIWIFVKAVSHVFHLLSSLSFLLLPFMRQPYDAVVHTESLSSSSLLLFSTSLPSKHTISGHISVLCRHPITVSSINGSSFTISRVDRLNMGAFLCIGNVIFLFYMYCVMPCACLFIFFLFKLKKYTSSNSCRITRISSRLKLPFIFSFNLRLQHPMEFLRLFPNGLCSLFIVSILFFFHIHTHNQDQFQLYVGLFAFFLVHSLFAFVLCYCTIQEYSQ